MPSPSLRSLTLVACTALSGVLLAQSPKPVTLTKTSEVRMPTLAKGTFDVTLAPLTEAPGKHAWAPGRMALDKAFKGDLEATSQGEMATAMSEVQGSGGYTAVEKVSGRLLGRSGTFLLLHFGVMARGIPGEWIVRVIPDSGTGELKGLTGKMTITITGKQHDYALEFTLPDAP